MTELNGTWHNQHGSTLELYVAPDGRVSGSFRTAVGLAARAEQFPVTGWTAGDRLGLVVEFPGYDALTTWAGHVVEEASGPAISTVWHMAVSPPARRAEQVWKGVWTGADVFRRESYGAPVPTGAIASHPSESWRDTEEIPE